MSRSRDLANLAGDATGLETLTVSDITDLTATATELNYVDGVSNPLQTQINAKAPIASPTFTGTTNVSSGVTLPSNPSIALGSNATFPAHHVIQVKYYEHNNEVTVTNPSSSSAGPWIDVLTGGTITPANSSNKILVIGTGSAGGSSSAYEFSWRLVRSIGGGNDTAIGGNLDPNERFLGTHIFMSGVSTGENAVTLTNTYLDTPNTTSQIEYKLQCMSGESTTVYANRGYSTNNLRTWANSANTTLTLMEIQG